jgi:uncharacterized phage protein (TIGR01671 family)
MQNEILLYRGKRIDGKGYVYGLPVTRENKDKLYILVDGCLLNISYEIIPESLAKYIGEDDKNGNKVFDNDVMKGKFASGMGGLSTRYKKMIGFVNTQRIASLYRYSLGNFRFSPHVENSIVIGNAFDNPELFKETQK